MLVDNNQDRPMRALALASTVGLSVIAFTMLAGADEGRDGDERALSQNDRNINAHARNAVAEGRQIFRFDTFGSEAFFGDALQLHKAIAGAKNGGVGPGVSPKTALAVGLKVDADALPENLKAQIKAGKVNLDDPATTLALLQLNAVVGLTGKFDQSGKIQSLGAPSPQIHKQVGHSI
jgi:hypothetical protein